YDEPLSAALGWFDPRGVQVQFPFVEALALAERGQVECVRIVRDEQEARLDGVTVDRDAERLPVREQDRPCPNPRKCFAASPLRFTAMHEPRVDAERHVVQEEAPVHATDVDAPFTAGVERTERSDRIVTIETQIAGEMVTGSERDADERAIALECNLGHGRQRAVAAGHP